MKNIATDFFSSINKYLDDLAAGATDASNQLSDLRVRRALIAGAPMSREDTEAWFQDHINKAGQRYQERFQKRHQHMQRHALTKIGEQNPHEADLHLSICANVETIALNGGPGDALLVCKAIEEYECFADPERAMATVRKALDNWDWRDTGLTREKREQELKKLDAEIDILEKQQKEIEDKVDRIREKL